MTEGTQILFMASNNPMGMDINANLLRKMSKEQLIEMVMGLNTKIT